MVVGLGLVLWLMFFGMGLKSLDPDFGWHLQIGRRLWQEGIPATDPFSYTMPSFPWVDHGRGSDMAIAKLYEIGGMPGLAAISGAIILAALALVIPFRLWTWSIVPILLGGGILVTRGGIRPQIEDWLVIAVLVRLLGERELWRKWRKFIPLGFAVWANFHGGFVMGLGIMALTLMIDWVTNVSREKKDVGVWLLSAAATLINPYGWRLWEEVWLTMSDGHLRTSIAEWMPFYYKAELGYWLLAAMFISAAKTELKSFRLARLITAGILFLAGLLSLRNMPFFVLAAIPIVGEWIEMVYNKIKTNTLAVKRAKIFYGLLVGIGLVLFLIETLIPLGKTFQGKSFKYPEEAVKFLQSRPRKGRVFAEYGWGGYLIWKLPGERLFIDGRMPSWRWKAPPGESDWAFKDYEKIIKGDFEEEFNKYNVGTVLWGRDKGAEKNQGWFDALFKEKKKTGKTFGEKLVDKGWIEVYHDDTAVIYEKGNTQGYGNE